MNRTLTLHGANPEYMYRAFGIEMPQRVIDFSTNTNVLSWPEISIDLESLVSRYPDPECSRLRRIIAERENVSVSRVLITNGVNEAIFLLAGAFTESTAILEPAYSEYHRAFRNLQSIYTLNDAAKFRSVIIINPNNPTGKFLPDLSRVIEKNPETVFIVDEAYTDFLRDAEPERLCEHENAIILRSLTKIFHLSGARIGYVIAGERVIESLRGLQPTWSVNAVAQELAKRFLTDGRFLERTREFYRRETPAFTAALRRAGFEVMDSDVHFFLVKTDDDLRMIAHLLRAGIVVRHTRNFPQLDGKYIRVATRRPDENKLLLEAVTSWTA